MQRAGMVVLAVALGTAIAIVLLVAAPWIVPPCPFHELTGLACPGCGGTRALRALIQGEPGRALAHNPFIVLSLPLLALAGVRVAWRTALRRDPLSWRVPSVCVWLYVAVLLAFTALRNVPQFETLLGPGR